VQPRPDVISAPQTLSDLLDLLRAKGVATFEWEERGDGGAVLKHALSLEHTPFRGDGIAESVLRLQRDALERDLKTDATPQDITRGHDATANPIERRAFEMAKLNIDMPGNSSPRVSDIDLALNPPALDYDAPDEGADISTTVASLEAPRESAPVGAAEPDDAP